VAAVGFVAGCAVLFVAGAYAGKALEIYSRNGRSFSFADAVSAGFWEPSPTWWLYGFATLCAAFLIAAVLRWLCAATGQTAWCCLRYACGCCDDGGDANGGAVEYGTAAHSSRASANASGGGYVQFIPPPSRVTTSAHVPGHLEMLSI
jgi:hypothetical protein